MDSNPSIKWCPRPGCGCSISLADQLRARNLDASAVHRPSLTVRCSCGHAFCWHCLEEGHEPALCSQVCPSLARLFALREVNNRQGGKLEVGRDGDLGHMRLYMNMLISLPLVSHPWAMLTLRAK